MKLKAMLGKIVATTMATMVLFSSPVWAQEQLVDSGSSYESVEQDAFGMRYAKPMKKTTKKTTKNNTKKNATQKNTTKKKPNQKSVQPKKIKRVNPSFSLDVVEANIEFVLKEEGSPVKVAYNKNTHLVSLSDGVNGASISIAPVASSTKGQVIKIYVPNEKWVNTKINATMSNMVHKDVFRFGNLNLNMDQSTMDFTLPKGFGGNVTVNSNLSVLGMNFPQDYASAIDVSLNQSDVELNLPQNFAGSFDGKTSVSTVDFKLPGGYQNSDVEITAMEGTLQVPSYFESLSSGYRHSASNAQNRIKWSVDPTSSVNFLS